MKKRYLSYTLVDFLGLNEKDFPTWIVEEGESAIEKFVSGVQKFGEMEVIQKVYKEMDQLISETNRNEKCNED